MAGILGKGFIRKFSTAQPLRSAQGGSHEHGDYRTWKKLTFFVVAPALTLCTINAYLGTKEHQTHPRPEFVAYEHLRIRNKPFPWGDGNHSLFHNPHTNALPTGYETPDPNAGNKHH